MEAAKEQYQAAKDKLKSFEKVQAKYIDQVAEAKEEYVAATLAYQNSDETPASQTKKKGDSRFQEKLDGIQRQFENLFEETGVDQSAHLDDMGANVKDSVTELYRYVCDKASGILAAAQAANADVDGEMKEKDQPYQYGQEEQLSEMDYDLYATWYESDEDLMDDAAQAERKAAEEAASELRKNDEPGKEETELGQPDSPASSAVKRQGDQIVCEVNELRAVKEQQAELAASASHKEEERVAVSASQEAAQPALG